MLDIEPATVWLPHAVGWGEEALWSRSLFLKAGCVQPFPHGTASAENVFSAAQGKARCYAMKGLTISDGNSEGRRSIPLERPVWLREPMAFRKIDLMCSFTAA